MDIEGIAREVRKDFESKSIDPLLLQKLYAEYNDIPDIEYFISLAVKQFPSFNCGVASVYLQHIFREGEIIQGKYLEHDHTFLLLDKNLVVDITADQYNGPKIYVGDLASPWHLK